MSLSKLEIASATDEGGQVLKLNESLGSDGQELSREYSI
jgi:hypothetical protein